MFNSINARFFEEFEVPGMGLIPPPPWYLLTMRFDLNEIWHDDSIDNIFRIFFAVTYFVLMYDVILNVYAKQRYFL